MIYNLHIFTRNGDCIYYHEWNRTKEQTISQEEVCAFIPHLCRLSKFLATLAQEYWIFSTSSAAGVQAHVRHDLFHQVFCKEISAKAQVSALDYVFIVRVFKSFATLVSVWIYYFRAFFFHLLANHTTTMPALNSKEAFRFYKTNQYKLHFHETPTGLKFILSTSPEIGDIDGVLRQIYSMFCVIPTLIRVGLMALSLLNVACCLSLSSDYQSSQPLTLCFSLSLAMLQRKYTPSMWSATPCVSLSSRSPVSFLLQRWTII